MKSENSAINILQKVYRATDSDTLETAAMFAILGKDIDDKKHKNHVASLVSVLSYYKLITTNHKVTKDGYRRRVSITLTAKGRQALGREGKVSTLGVSQKPIVSVVSRLESQPAANTVLTPQALQNLVDEYNKNNPSWPFELLPKGFRKEEVSQG